MKQSLIVYRRLLTFARPYWAGFGLALLGMVVAAATEPLLPAALKPLLDEGFVKKADFPLWWIPVSIIGIFVVRGVGTFVSSYGLNWVANKVMADMRRILFAHLLRLPAAEFEQRAAGLMISRVVFDIGNVGEAVTRVLLILIRDSLVIVGLLAYLLWLNWKLTLVAFVLIPVMGGLITLVSKRMMRLSRQSLDLVGEMTRDVEEAVHGYKVIKIFGAYERESQVFQRTVERLRGVLMRITVSAGLTTPMTQMCAAVAVSAVVSVALLQAGDGQTTVGGFASFITALLMLLSPLKHLADINGPLQRGLAAAENVFEMLDHASEPDRGSRTLSRARGEVRFEQVVFRYPGAQVDALRGITLEVKAGEVVALVGGSGGGKTTLINLLPRFFSPTSGRVLLDGVPIEELTLASLREQMAL